jgi:hypothetical protein
LDNGRSTLNEMMDYMMAKNRKLKFSSRPRRRAAGGA